MIRRCWWSSLDGRGGRPLSMRNTLLQSCIGSFFCTSQASWLMLVCDYEFFVLGCAWIIDLSFICGSSSISIHSLYQHMFSSTWPSTYATLIIAQRSLQWDIKDNQCSRVCVWSFDQHVVCVTDWHEQARKSVSPAIMHLYVLLPSHHDAQQAEDGQRSLVSRPPITGMVWSLTWEN